MIRMENVNKVYEVKTKSGWFRSHREQKQAIKNLSLEINPGEIVGLLGLNGAGKTTTIKMLSTLLQPTSGRILVDEMDIERDRRKIQARVNMIAGGERMLYWRLTGRENLVYFGRMYGLEEGVIAERATTLLADLGLKDAANIPVEKYSKGMKQRLQIARGLINNPDYLFLDEPTLGLDAPIARQLRSSIRTLANKENKGILLTSHYLQEVEELCDRVYVIDKGRLLFSDTPQRIIVQVAGQQVLHLTVENWQDSAHEGLAKHLHMPIENILVTKQIDQQFTVAISTDIADDVVPPVLTWLSNQNILVRGITISKPTLEDAIIHLSESEGVSRHEPVLNRISS